MTTIITKTAHEIRKGDIFREHGGRFEVVSDLRESNSHRPEGYWPNAGVGPSDCVVADAVCIDGEVRGYFRPGSSWTMQGNHRATFRVEVAA